MRYSLCQTLLIEDLTLVEALRQIIIQDLTCAKGKVTLGSAVVFESRPFRKLHLSTDVAQAPATMRPVASATLLLQEFTLVGDIPTAVLPQICPV